MAKKEKEILDEKKDCKNPGECKAPECDCKSEPKGEAKKGDKKKAAQPKKVGSLKERRLARQKHRQEKGLKREAPFKKVEGE